MRKQMSPELEALLAKAKARVEAMTPEERDAEYAAQRDSWLRGELGMGSDADEAAGRAFYDALKLARTDPASTEPGSEMAKLAARMGPGSRIAGLMFGPKGAGMTPEEIAGQINRTIDEVDSGALPTYSTFAEAEAASRRQE